MLLPVTELPLAPRTAWDPERAAPQQPAGTVVRSALGPALRALSCERRCAPRAPCSAPDRCAFGLVFDRPGDNPPDLRLDASDLERPLEPGEPASLRITVLDAALRPVVATALRHAVERGLGPWEARVRFTSGEPRTAAVDVLARAAALGEDLLVELCTPVRIRGWRADGPHPLDPLLSSTWRRARQLELPVHELPPFTPGMLATPLDTRTTHGRAWSSRQRRAYPIEGQIGAWRVRAHPAQVAWLALAEQLGVGVGPARGLGVIRCTPFEP